MRILFIKGVLTASYVYGHSTQDFNSSGCETIATMRRRHDFLVTNLAFSLLFGWHGLMADDVRPGIVEIDEVSAMGYIVRLTPPPGVGWRIHQTNTMPFPVRFPDTCAETGVAAYSRQYECPHDLSGRSIGFDFRGLTRPAHMLVRLRLLSGDEYTTVLAPSIREWRVPRQETLARVLWDYFNYGVIHIFKGIDHLLFVLCLIWIARDWRRILWTITAFTIAHSMALATAALGLVRLAVPPVEAIIALSVAFLASEVIRDRHDSLTWRYPSSVAAAFGLVHGLGFASVLSDIGLPQTKALAALLSFNLGVEIGQVLFALPIALALWRMRIASWGIDALRLTVGYGVGAIAAFWAVMRINEFIS